MVIHIDIYREKKAQEKRKEDERKALEAVLARAKAVTW